MAQTPPRIDKLRLDISNLEEAQTPPAASSVLIPEAMTRFRCNLQGCCCGGWQVTLRGHDLVRLGKRVSPEDRAKLSNEVTIRAKRHASTGEQVIEAIVLNDPAGTCRFVSEDKKLCTLHSNYGLQAMPDVCVDFPVVAYGQEGGQATFVFDPACPSVLDQIDEDDGPMQVVALAPPWDESTTLRSTRPRWLGAPTLKGRALTGAELTRFRDGVLASLAETRRPWWQHLHALERASQRLAKAGDLEGFEVVPPSDPRSFLVHLGRCLAMHGAEDLLDMLLEYRRFVFDVPLELDEAGVTRLKAQLEAGWPGGTRTQEVGRANPLLVRWMAHAFTKPYDPPDNDVSAFAATVTFRLATALRYAAAIAGTLGREIDRPIMKVAIGAAEFFYRGAIFAPGAMPVFEDPEA